MRLNSAESDDHRLLEQILEQATHLRRDGLPVDVEKYVGDYPHLANDIRQLLGVLSELDPYDREGCTVTMAPDTDADSAADGGFRLRTAGLRFPTLPDYRVVREIGRGGMGVVYEARDLRLKRPVALKMILAAEFASAEHLQRFRREAELVARLKHSNIVQIYDVGDQDGRPYLALEYVDGKTLADFADGKPLPVRRAAELLEALARAAHHAHQNGIVHRDLKPSNILMARHSDSIETTSLHSTPNPSGLTLSGVVTSDGWTPKITDFGLAKDLLDSADQSRTGTVLGTPSYMSPEQAGGHVRETGPATDVYSLGAILYTLLTGRPPFQGTTAVETVRMVVATQPVPPSHLQPRLPIDLETVCLKCLNKETSRRYASAGELADDLHRFLTGKPILARPTGSVEKTWRWCRRNPVVAGLSAGLLTALVCGFGVSVYYMLMAKYAAELASGEQKRAEAIARQASERAYVSDMRQIPVAWESSLLDEVRELLRAQLPDGFQGHDLRGFEWYYWNRLVNRSKVVGQHANILNCVRFSPDGEFLAGAGRDPDIHIRPVGQTGEVQVLRGHLKSVNRVCFSPDGSQLVSGGDDNTVRLWDCRTGQEIRKWTEHQDSVTCVDWSPDGTWIASSSLDRTVVLRNLADGSQTRSLPHPDPIHQVAFLPTGGRVASGCDGGVVRIWNIASGKESIAFSRHQHRITAIACSKDGRYLASSGHESTTRIWKADTGELVHDLKRPRWDDLDLAFSPDSRKMAAASFDRTITVFDVESGGVDSVNRGHSLSVRSIAWHPDGLRMASGGEEGDIRLWPPGREEPSVARHRPSVLLASLVCSGDGRWLASSGGNVDPVTRERTTEVLVWDRQNMDSPHRIEDQNSGANCLAFSRDGQYLAAAGGAWDSVEKKFERGLVKIWNTEDWKLLPDLSGHSKRVYTLAVSDDSQWIASGGTIGDILVRRFPDGSECRSVDCGLEKEVTALAFSPDGSRLAIGGFDRRLILWDLQKNRELASLESQMPFSAVAFRPDGREIAVADYNAVLRICDANTLRERMQLRGHTGGIASVAFSTDGKRLLTGSEDSTVKVWDAATGRELLTLSGHTKVVKAVAFSPDQKTVYSGGWDETLRIWDTSQ